MTDPNATQPPAEPDGSSDSGDSDGDPMPRSPWNRLRVLCGAALFVLAAFGIYLLLPWILPLSIAEGPLVQRPVSDQIAVVWYTSRPATCSLLAGDGASAAAVPVESSGRRHVALLPPGSANASVRYVIASGERRLFEGAVHAAGASELRVAVFGDSGKGTREQYQLGAQLVGFDPDFVVHTGDLIYPGGERRRYSERFFRPYRETLACVPFWPSLGNHDVSEPEFARGYFEVFELPDNGPTGTASERHYAFTVGRATFVVVDSNLDEQELAEKVAPWVIDAFAQTSSPWRFAVFHHPPYTVGPHGPSERMQRALVPALEQAGVDVVFNGHDHLYCRTVPLRGGVAVEPGQGIVYVVSGAGGARLYSAVEPGKRPDYIAAFHDATHGLTELTIREHEITVRHRVLGGQVVDDWTLHKASAAAQ